MAGGKENNKTTDFTDYTDKNATKAQRHKETQR